MKFFVDAHLPPRLVRWLQAAGHDAVHASELPGGLATSDRDIWALASREGMVILSKDADFVDMVALRGAPPCLIHFAVGNATAAELIILVAAAWPHIQVLLSQPDVSVLQLQREGVIAWRR